MGHMSASSATGFSRNFFHDGEPDLINVQFPISNSYPMKNAQLEGCFPLGSELGIEN
jgi:hypothetical protein